MLQKESASMEKYPHSFLFDGQVSVIEPTGDLDSWTLSSLARAMAQSGYQAFDTNTAQPIENNPTDVVFDLSGVTGLSEDVLYELMSIAYHTHTQQRKLIFAGLNESVHATLWPVIPTQVAVFMPNLGEALLHLNGVTHNPNSGKRDTQNFNAVVNS